MKCPWALCGPLTSVALLLPIPVAADSHVQTAAVNGELRATAHVDFKIIIPKTLSLSVGTTELHRESGSQTVAVISNNRTVTLDATLHPADRDATGEIRRSVILSAAARKIIAQDATCAPRDAELAGSTSAPRIVANTGRMVCTVSTP